jgi:hypothetical protein
VPERSGGYSFGELTALAAKAREQRLDLYHAPHYGLPVRLHCPSVVTIYDVIHLTARACEGSLVRTCAFSGGPRRRNCARLTPRTGRCATITTS